MAALTGSGDTGPVSLTIELDGWPGAALQSLAARRGLSPAQVVALLVEAEVARESAPAPDAADLDARAAGEPGGVACRDAWTVRVTPPAAAEMAAFPPTLQAIVAEQLKRLAADPGPADSGPADPAAPARLRVGFRACGTQWRLVLQRDEDARELRLLVATTRENAPR